MTNLTPVRPHTSQIQIHNRLLDANTKLLTIHELCLCRLKNLTAMFNVFAEENRLQDPHKPIQLDFTVKNRAFSNLRTMFENVDLVGMKPLSINANFWGTARPTPELNHQMLKIALEVTMLSLSSLQVQYKEQHLRFEQAKNQVQEAFIPDMTFIDVQRLQQLWSEFRCLVQTNILEIDQIDGKRQPVMALNRSQH